MKTPSLAIQHAIYEALNYDPTTGEIRWRQNRRRATEGELAGSISRDGNLVIGFNGTSYQAHHIAWCLETGDWPSAPILFADKDPLNLVFSNLYQTRYAENSKADYMRDWRKKQKRANAARSRQQQTSSVPGVHFGYGDVWSVRDGDNANTVLASFSRQEDAEAYGRAVIAGRQFIRINPPKLFGAPRDNTPAGGPGTLTYGEAAARFAYDPDTGAIYRRRSIGNRVDTAGTPAVEIDDTRRPIVRASGRTYSAGMLAWFLHTGGEWPRRKQLGYRDGNRKNLRWDNLFL